MELSFFPYEGVYSDKEHPHHQLKYSGALLRGRDENGNSGYSSYHSLESHGDPSAEEFIAAFSDSKFSMRHQLALNYVQQDMQNRLQNIDSLAGAFQLENHKLITRCYDLDVEGLNQYVDTQFKYLKIKVGRNVDKETSWLGNHLEFFRNKGIKLRLDFNSSMGPDEFSYWLLHNGWSTSELVDYIEDPTEYDSNYWRDLKGKGLRLAKDITNGDPWASEGVSTFVLKPSLVNVVEWLKKLPNPKEYQYVITHYMDSPLAVAQAAASALKLQFFVRDRLKACGLLHAPTLPEFKDWQIECRGPHLVFGDDKGLGFSKQLQELDWKHVSYELAQ